MRWSLIIHGYCVRAFVCVRAWICLLISPSLSLTICFVFWVTRFPGHFLICFVMFFFAFMPNTHFFTIEIGLPIDSDIENVGYAIAVLTSKQARRHHSKSERILGLILSDKKWNSVNCWILSDFQTRKKSIKMSVYATSKWQRSYDKC